MANGHRPMALFTLPFKGAKLSAVDRSPSK
jgi:hypothetical protein